jgi:hypothetical protein
MQVLCYKDRLIDEKSPGDIRELSIHISEGVNVNRPSGREELTALQQACLHGFEQVHTTQECLVLS